MPESNHRPRGIPAIWTFSLWLHFQQHRTDAVGTLARQVAQAATWPGWRALTGVEEHLREQGAEASTLHALRQAYSEWEAARAEAVPDKHQRRTPRRGVPQSLQGLHAEFATERLARL